MILILVQQKILTVFQPWNFLSQKPTAHRVKVKCWTLILKIFKNNTSSKATSTVHQTVVFYYRKRIHKWFKSSKSRQNTIFLSNPQFIIPTIHSYWNRVRGHCWNKHSTQMRVNSKQSLNKLSAKNQETQVRWIWWIITKQSNIWLSSVKTIAKWTRPWRNAHLMIKHRWALPLIKLLARNFLRIRLILNNNFPFDREMKSFILQWWK